MGVSHSTRHAAPAAEAPAFSRSCSPGSKAGFAKNTHSKPGNRLRFNSPHARQSMPELGGTLGSIHRDDNSSHSFPIPLDMVKELRRRKNRMAASLPGSGCDSLNSIESFENVHFGTSPPRKLDITTIHKRQSL